jgi:RNA polymerase sigma-70 factor (ECF subfamily)
MKRIVTNAPHFELPGMPEPETTSTSPSDAQIVRAVLLGDVDVFAHLVDRYHARCLRVATHLLGDSDDAEDAVQEAFVRAYRHLGSYRERDRFGAWLLRIVVNQCRTRVTREARYLPFDAEQHDSESATDSTANLGDQRAELAHALAQLGPDQREALVLRFAEELSYEEISSLTGVGISALKMRVQRACTRMRVLLAEHLHT